MNTIIPIIFKDKCKFIEKEKNMIRCITNDLKNSSESDKD